LLLLLLRALLLLLLRALLLLLLRALLLLLLRALLLLLLRALLLLLLRALLLLLLRALLLLLLRALLLLLLRALLLLLAIRNSFKSSRASRIIVASPACVTCLMEETRLYRFISLQSGAPRVMSVCPALMSVRSTIKHLASKFTINRVLLMRGRCRHRGSIKPALARR
jgi:hypothetical protein